MATRKRKRKQPCRSILGIEGDEAVAGAIPRWLDLRNALESIAKNPKPTRAQVGTRYASVITGLDKAGLELLIGAFRDTAEWFAHAHRGPGFGNACGNASVRSVLKKLFVLEQPTDLTFVTDASVIEAAAEDVGGMNWNRSNTVTRKRKNKVMNWGTAGTRYEVLSEHEYKNPVILVPEAGTESKTVFFVSPKLVREAQSLVSRANKVRLDNSTELPFWHDFLHLCNLITINADERECFTYTTKVSCSVSLLDSRSLRGVRNETGRARRRPVLEAV